MLSASDGAWETSDAFVGVGFLAIIVLFGLQHGFFQPKVREAKALAERDLKSGDTLSPEFEALGDRIGKVGGLAGVIVVVTIFFMTYKPFLYGAARGWTKLDASLPVAMFDSGVGGLTVLHECLVSLPEEDFVYLGDTAWFPYGTRDPDALRERIARIAELLLGRGAKLLVIACNTATAIGTDVARAVAGAGGVEVVPVVEPQAEIAAAITDNGKVGVLATPNTVESGAYRRALEAEGRPLEVTEVEAPKLAPFIQQGSPFDESVMAMARAYCEPLKRAEVDTLILGCTHYPLVAPMLQRILGRDIRLVSGGHAVAAAVQRTMERAGIARERDGEGAYRFLCTGDTDSFRDLGTRFLQMPLGEVERVEIAAGHCRSET